MGTEIYWAMMHHEISIAGAMRCETGIEAMNGECGKLECPEGRPPAWDVTKVESKRDVFRELGT